MKKVLSLTLLLLFCTTTIAQENNSQPQEERYVYLWDVTRSMLGYGDRNENIYNNVRDMIIDDINSIPQNSNTEIVVVAFRGQLDKVGYRVWRGYADRRGKEYLAKEMRDFVTTKESVGNTNTATALKYAINNILSPDKVDYLKIMTDGGCDEENEFRRLLANWCQIKEEKNVYAYYITLTNKAYELNTKFKKDINPDCFMFIKERDAVALVRQLTPTTRTDIRYNLLEDRGKELKYKFEISLGDRKIEPGFKIRCRTINNSTNDFFKIDTVIEFDTNNKIVTLVPEVEDYAYHLMGSDEEREVEIEFTPYERNDEKFKFVVISDNKQFVVLQNSEQRLQLETTKVDCNVRESNCKIKLAFACNIGDIKPGYRLRYHCEYFHDREFFKAEGIGMLDDNLTLTITPQISTKAKDPENLQPNIEHDYANIIITPTEGNRTEYKNVRFISPEEGSKCRVSLFNKTLRTVKIHYVK